jgi:hypothetical protein
MIAHILGNGPSKSQFRGFPVGDIYGCNLADSDRNLTATFIMDKSVLHHIANNGIRLNFPVIVPHSLKNLAVGCTVLDTLPREIENGESTGHHGVQYLIRKGYKEIHMWGFDSLYRDTVESDTQQKMPESVAHPTNFIRWRDKWDRIFKEASGCNIIVHRSS